MSDLIKREDAIEAIKGNSYALGDDYTEINGYGAIKDIRALPSADRPQGEWEDAGKDPSHSHPLTAIWYRCSECGDGTNAKTNYCPHCGARMKGSRDIRSI